MALNVADTRVLLIEPKLRAAGWRDTQITREHYYDRNQTYTDGRVFRLSPFREMGRAVGAIQHFGAAERLQATLNEMQQRLYAA